MRRAALVAILALALAAHAERRPPYGGSITASLLSAPTQVDPTLALSDAEVSFVDLTGDTLYRLDAQGDPVPALAAAAPTLSKGGLEARIPIRAGLKFSDGSALDTADIVASLRRAEGAPLAAWALAPVKKIRAEKGAIVLTLRRQTPDLAELLAIPQLAITPGGKAPSARAFVGAGPFAVTKLNEGGRKLELTAQSGYHAGRPYLDGVTLRWFDDPDDEARGYEAGDADVSLRGAVAFAGHTPKYPTDEVSGPATILVFLGFGQAHPGVLADADFRRAVSFALSRSAMKMITSGERVLPATLPESPDLGGSSPSSTEIDARTDDAAAALSKAGRAHADLKKDLALELLVDKTRPDDAEVAARVVEALDAVGLKVTFTELDPKEFARRVAAGDCDLWIGQLVAPTTELTHEYALAFAAGGDKWAQQELASAAVDRQAFATAFGERLPIVPLYHRAVLAHERKLLRGLGFDAVGRLDLADAFLVPDGKGK